MRARTREPSRILLASALPWVVAAGVFMCASASAQETPPTQQSPAPIHFRVEIDVQKPYDKILEEGLDLVRWQRDERVTMPLLQRLVAEARKAASDALAAHGYFSPDVRTQLETPAAGEALVRISIELGPRTMVRNVDLDFTGAALTDPEGRKRIDLVKETWKLPAGEPFQQAEWDAAKDEALVRLGRGRYAAARIVDSEARIEPEQQSAYLKLKLDSGPIFHAGPTVVTGLKRYRPSVVDNLNPMRPGEPYDAIKLDLFQRRLLETGYFNAVNFAIDADPEKAAAAPLNISVIEAPSQRIDTGITFSTDTRFGVTVDYRNANIFDSAWRFRPRFNVNTKEQELNVTFDTPPRPGGVWDTYSTRLQRRDIENQLTREAVVGYAHNWGLESTPSQVSLSAHFERQTIAAANTENNYALFAGFRKTFRTTDDVVSPRRGVLGTFEVGASIPGLATQDFARVRTRVSWLIPAGLRNDILVRGEAGVVLANSRFGIPSSFLFRTGGDQTIRGYAFESIGVPQADAIVGGRYLALASVEYTRWVTDSLGAAVFVDGGDAFDRTSAFDAAVGYGVGVRWRSPVGPFRGDLAYGERTNSLRLHFSVGFSF